MGSSGPTRTRRATGSIVLATGLLLLRRGRRGTTGSWTRRRCGTPRTQILGLGGRPLQRWTTARVVDVRLHPRLATCCTEHGFQCASAPMNTFSPTSSISARNPTHLLALRAQEGAFVCLPVPLLSVLFAVAFFTVLLYFLLFLVVPSLPCHVAFSSVVSFQHLIDLSSPQACLRLVPRLCISS